MEIISDRYDSHHFHDKRSFALRNSLLSLVLFLLFLFYSLVRGASKRFELPRTEPTGSNLVPWIKKHFYSIDFCDRSDTLKRYRRKDITLTLPDGKTMANIKWFAVWCDEFSVSKERTRHRARDLRFPRLARHRNRYPRFPRNFHARSSSVTAASVDGKRWIATRPTPTRHSKTRSRGSTTRAIIEIIKFFSFFFFGFGIGIRFKDNSRGASFERWPSLRRNMRIRENENEIVRRSFGVFCKKKEKKFSRA